MIHFFIINILVTVLISFLTTKIIAIKYFINIDDYSKDIINIIKKFFEDSKDNKH